MADPATGPEGSYATALAYAECGLRVLPIKPGTKRPPMREWVEAATTDADIIRNWFTGMYSKFGVGLAMGRQPDGRAIFALDVDEHDPAHSGTETLFELQAVHGSLPDTWCSVTGSGGMHILFTSDVEVRNGVAGDGLDVRGEGGQIVVSPSVHPTTDRTYEWEHGYAPWERDIAPAPDWLMKLVTHEPELEQPVGVKPSSSTFDFREPDSPAEWLRSQWNWPLQLRDAGWTEHHTDRSGDVFWTRPGKDRRDGESAVLHVPDGPFVVFSTDASMAGLHQAGHVNRDGSVSVTPFEFYAAQRHGGDLTSAARAVNTMMSGEPDSRLSPDEPYGGGGYIEGFLGQELDWRSFWTDDHGGENWVAEPVIAEGRLTVLYAPAKQGKSEIALAVVAALATGKPILGQRNPHGPRHAVYLDYEMTKADLFERLELLGYDENDDWSHLHYYLLPSLPPLDTSTGCVVIRAIAAHHDAEVVVIDTLGRAVEGDENSNDTYRAFARHTGVGLKSDGIAVVRTDHAGKDKDRGQRGASAKNDDADVVFRVDRTDTGWKMERTHTRVSWIPERVVIDRATRADGTLRIELSPTQSTATYIEGTQEYVKQLLAAGITVDHTTTKAQLTAMARALDPPLSKSGTMMSSALRWMKDSMPRFTGGPTPVEPSDSRLSGPDKDDVL